MHFRVKMIIWKS